MNRAIGLLAAAAVCLASGCSVSPEAGLGMERPEFRAGDSRPVLKWESFPVEGDPIAEAHPTDVTYDLRVYHGDPWGRPLGAPVYERSGLVENSHRVEAPLERGRTCVWTVRARFRLNGSLRRTPWSGADPRERLGWAGDLSPSYHRLEIP